MSEPLSSLELLPEEEGGANLTYFVFAAPTASAPNLPAVLPGPLPGVLPGCYHLERMLGVGGMGTVYRARDLFHKQFNDPAPLVASKLPNESVAKSPDASALFYSELTLTRRLRHPDVVCLFTFDVDTACQRAYIIIGLMPGLPLDRLLCERPEGLPQSELNAIVRPLLDALVYAHEQGMLHGNLKPSNVMLDEEDVRFFDFNLGQTQAGTLDDLPQLSRGHIDAWTPGCATPELLEGALLSPTVDLYALVCALYELADSHHPFRRLLSNQTRGQGLECQLHAPGHLPRRYWPALRTALNPDPERRCIDVHELQEALGVRRSWLASVLAR